MSKEISLEEATYFLMSASRKEDGDEILWHRQGERVAVGKPEQNELSVNIDNRTQKFNNDDAMRLMKLGTPEEVTEQLVGILQRDEDSKPTTVLQSPAQKV